MAAAPLDRRILGEIRARLKESRAAVEEYERLRAALTALETAGGATPAPARRRRSGPAPTKRRAPRGANRDMALAVIADRPGVTVAELAAATGIAKKVLYGLTRSLTERGQIERVGLPGDTFGFRIAGSTDHSDADAHGDGSPVAPARRARRTRTPRTDATEADSNADQAAEEPVASSEPARA